MSHFEFTDHWGDLVTIHPERVPSAHGPVPTVELRRADGRSIRIPADRLEEVIAGLRDIARQAGAQADPCSGCRYVPCGTCTPAAGAQPVPLPGAPITDEQYAHAAAVLPPGARIAAEAVRQAAQSTQDDFGLATGGPGPNAEGAGA